MRRRNPEVLTALLASLTSVFKYVMIPSVSESNNTVALSTTWTYLSTALVKCNSEVQRAVAEVWSSVLRRLRKDDRQQCVDLMMGLARMLNDFVAWSLVFAAKSVAQTIHTSEEFSTVAEPLAQKFIETSDAESSKRMLDMLIVPCTVRQGSRMTCKLMSTIMGSTMKLPFDTNLRNSLLALTIAVLNASPADLSIWMGAGRRVTEYAWSVDAQLAVSLTGSLLEVGWKGFSQFALSPFLKKCSDLLAGMLKNMDELWRSRLADWMRVWIGRFTVSEDSVIMLAEMTALTPMLSSYNLLPPLISLAR
ncbi:UTP20_7 [Sanghuangporus weigelae]